MLLHTVPPVTASIAFSVLILVPTPLRSPPDPPERVRLQMDKLGSQDSEVRKEGFRLIAQERAHWIRALKQVAATGANAADPDVRHMAVRLLGEFRAEDALFTIMQNLAAPDNRPRGVSGDSYFQDAYPAVAAMVKIGQPAFKPMLIRAEGTDDSMVHASMAALLERVLGHEMAMFYIDRKIAAQDDPKKCARLKEVRSHLKVCDILPWPMP